MNTPTYIPTDPEREEWDVIVVGCGMGGGTVGYELARLGRRVLFLEKGLILHGEGAGLSSSRTTPPSVHEDMLRHGRWPQRISGQTSFGPLEFFAPLGCGTGGSTGLYSAQLERFKSADFAPREWYDGPQGSNLPEKWPVSLEKMLPFYRRAEAHFAVGGTQDPLDPDPVAPLLKPPPMSERDGVLFENFQDLGLHPYRSHVAVEHVPDCLECDEVCRQGCKSDAGNRCVMPALNQHDAQILPRCEALTVLSSGRRIVGVRASWEGREVTLRTKALALGAGAWRTPVLLLRSRSADFPDGLANSSGLVGRNLMLHATDLIAVDPGEPHSTLGPKKSLSLNDFYEDGTEKFGTLQSVGWRMNAPTIEAVLTVAAERDPARWRRPNPRFLSRVAQLAEGRFGSASLLATIIEDLPYPENRVVSHPDSDQGIRFEYTYPEELHERSRRFQRRVSEVLTRRFETTVMPFGPNNLNFGHVCGTCCFGDDPKSSVLDSTNRAHDLDNLYVVDASFFPSSGAINPSLTIAANAFRVGGIIHEQL